MRNEPHKSITKARVDYRYGDADAASKLMLAFADINLSVHATPLLMILARVLPHCNANDTLYFGKHLSKLDGTEAWAVTWIEDGIARVDTGIAVSPADDVVMRNNDAFQAAHDLLARYVDLLKYALEIKRAQPVEAEFAAVNPS